MSFSLPVHWCSITKSRRTFVETEENVWRIPVHLGSPLRGGRRNREKMLWRAGKMPGACQVCTVAVEDFSICLFCICCTVMVITKWVLPRSKPEMMRVTPSFANHCQRVRNIKVFTSNILILIQNQHRKLSFTTRFVLTMFGWWRTQSVEQHGLRYFSLNFDTHALFAWRYDIHKTRI